MLEHGEAGLGLENGGGIESAAVFFFGPIHADSWEVEGPPKTRPSQNSKPEAKEQLCQRSLAGASGTTASPSVTQPKRSRHKSRNLMPFGCIELSGAGSYLGLETGEGRSRYKGKKHPSHYRFGHSKISCKMHFHFLGTQHLPQRGGGSGPKSSQ